MITKSIIAGVSLATIAFSSNALADQQETERDGWIVSVRSGLSLPTEHDLVSNRQGLDFDTRSRVGLVLGGSIAKDFGDLRLSFEFDSRERRVKRIDVQNGGDLFSQTGRFDGKGRESSQSFMVNAAYKVFEADKWRGYIGLGVGFANADFINVRIGSQTILDDNELQLAGQASTELIRDLGDKWEIGFGLRAWTTLPTDYDFGERIDNLSQDSFEGFIRFGYRFGGTKKKATPRKAMMARAQPAKAPPQTPAIPPAPEKPAAAPVAAEPVKPAPQPKPLVVPAAVTIYFDNNSADLSSASQRKIREAANAYQGTDKRVVIKVVGHTDRLGKIADNIALSQRRAAAVSDALVAEGVAKRDITTSYRGESENAVATADGVPNQQNRRVEITFAKK